MALVAVPLFRLVDNQVYIAPIYTSVKLCMQKAIIITSLSAIAFIIAGHKDNQDD